MFGRVLEEGATEAGEGLYDGQGGSFGVDGLTRLTIPPVGTSAGGKRAKSASGGVDSHATTTRAFGRCHVIPSKPISFSPCPICSALLCP